MEAVSDVQAPPRRPLTVTERNWLTAFSIVVASALLFYGLQTLEKRIGHADRAEAFVYHPVETPMRMVGLAHFLVAIAFMTTSRAMKSAGSWLWLVGLLAAGVVLCVLFARQGGVDNRLMNVLFFTYFLLHEFRDQAFFYDANGDLPRGPDAKRLKKDLLGIPALIFGWIAAVFIAGAGFSIGGARRYQEALLGWLPAGWPRAVAALVPAALMLFATLRWRRRIDRTYAEGVGAFLKRNRPLLFVFTGIVAVLVLDILINRRAYAIVTLHVAAWYVFVLAAFARRPAPTPAPKPATWRWVRATPAGFNVFHLGILAVVMVAAVAWAYLTRNDPSVSVANVILSREAFPYWTIMHVTVSWIPR